MFNEPLLEPILRYIRFKKVLNEITSGSVVVDIGCGHTPHLLNRLEKYIKKGIGLDPFCAQNTSRKIKILSLSLDEKIPLQKNSADYVTLVAVLEHLEKPLPLLIEAYRILKPGGKLLITTPSCLNKPLLEFLAFHLGIVSRREIAEHKRYYWKKGLLKLIRQSGFTNMKHEYFEIFLNNFVRAVK